jgi:phosphate starvation-inducible PhoH-like protein
VLPRSATQRAYIQAIRHHDIVFGIGPAGTGKTYLAVGLALQALRERAVRRIVLTRPAVEAGEKLGFLPGDLVEKVNPYLRPLHDAIHDLADGDLARTLIDRGDLEVAPLAFMRGRTLNDSFIILDEAQNTTHDQMKMFLTRMGLGSRMVVTGDVTQVDLPPGKISGLQEASRLLSDVDGIEVVRFSERDVVRHRLVRDIILAYEAHERDAAAQAGTDAAEARDGGRRRRGEEE